METANRGDSDRIRASIFLALIRDSSGEAHDD